MSIKPDLTHEEFKAIYSKVPRLCVEVVIKTEQGILLTLRKEPAYKGLWHIPGGTVDYRESLHDAVKRIAKQELAIEVSVEKLIGYIEYFSEEKERGFGYAVGIEFLCHPHSTDFHVDDQAYEAKFFQSFPENMVTEQKKFLSDYFL